MLVIVCSAQMTHWSICLICLLTRSQNRSTHSGSSSELATNHKTAQQLLMKDKLCSLAFKKQARLFVQMPSILIAYILWPVHTPYQCLLKVIDRLYLPWNVRNPLLSILLLLTLWGKDLILGHWEIVDTHTQTHMWQLQNTTGQILLSIKLCPFSFHDIKSRLKPYYIKVGVFYLVKWTRGIFFQ